MGRFVVQNEVVIDQSSGLMWPRNASLYEFPLSWDEAFAFIETLNQSGYAGYANWRLPHRRELFSLLSHKTINPSLPDGHPFEQVFPGYYWSATTCARLPDQAWYIHMGGARVFKGMKYNAYMVWPVRKPEDADGSSSSPASLHYQERTGTPREGTRFQVLSHMALDHASGLTWTLDANPYKKMISWPEAADLAARMNRESLHGYSDWRVPTIQDLESLVDLQQHTPALPRNHPFGDVQEFYWSATTSAYDSTYAWTLYLRDGAIGVGYKSQTEFYLWPVRGGLS